MRTVLDEAKTWFLESVAYVDDLQVLVKEGVLSDHAEDLQVGGKVMSNLRAIEITADSRRVKVCFAGVVAWQVVDESWTAHDDSEERDTGFLSVLPKSAYLDYVNKHHGWYQDIAGPAAHYRLWTENEVVDVVAHDEPVVQLVTGTE